MDLEELLFRGDIEEFCTQYHSTAHLDPKTQLLYAFFLQFKGRYTESLDVLKAIETSPGHELYADILLRQAYAYWGVSNYSKMNEILDLVHLYLSNNDSLNSILQGEFYRTRAIYHGFTGQYVKAISDNLHALEFLDSSSIRGVMDVVVVSTNLAINNIRQGSFAEAERRLKDISHLVSQIPNNPHTGHYYYALGLLLAHSGAESEALEKFRESEKIAKLWENNRDLSKIYLSAVEILSRRDLKLTQLWYEKLLYLESFNGTKIIDARRKVAKAIWQKANPRLHIKFKSQKAFEEILEGSLVSGHLRIKCISHLIELYLIEISVIDESEKSPLWVEIDQLISDLLNIANINNLLIYRVNGLILAAKFQYVRGDYAKYELLMDQAQYIAEESENQSLIVDVLHHRETVDKSILKSHRALDSNPSLTEKLTKSDIIDYLKMVQRVIL